MHANFPLFPLPVVAHPYCRLPLQIFEPRYLDLVKNCAATQQCFGVVTVDEKVQSARAYSSDTSRARTYAPPILAYGTAVRIVDFDQLSNGLLGIVCEGMYKFCVHDTAVSDANLLVGTIETIAQEENIALPEEYVELISVLQALLAHAYSDKLGYDLAHDENYWRRHASELSWHLASLLPVNNQSKYAWLTLDDPLQRLHAIAQTVNRMQAGD